MNLINQLLFAVLISSITSTFLLLVWWMLRGFFMLVDPKMIYTSLRWICLLYMLPIGYVAVIFAYRVWFQGQDKVWMLVFSRTEDITSGLHVISVIWFIIALVLLIYRWIDNKVWCRKFRDNIEVERKYDPDIVDTYEMVCDVLEIPKEKLSLQKNVLIDMPMIVGIRHPQVILPERDYTKEELEIIFFHELSHFKHKDLQCKILVVVVLMFHVFNPFCYVLLGIVNLWSEFMADASALEMSGQLHDAKLYFNKIVDLVPDHKKTIREKFLFSTLYKDDNTLSRRIDFMKKYQRARKAGKAVTAALTAAFVLMSTTTIFASGKTVADLHNFIYQSTEGQTQEVERMIVTEDGFVEHYCDVEDLNFDGLQEVSTLDQDIVTIDSGVHYNIDWIVNPNTRHVSGPYKVSKGENICAAVVVEPISKTYWLGIMDHEGHARYIETSGASSHHFLITETKSYRVFVQNNYKDGKTTLNAKGYFLYE